jgi:regulator of protease activity HflC (stomatin/prohibitin superfamily)
MATIVVSFLLLVGAVVAVAKRRVNLQASGPRAGHVPAARSVSLWPAAVAAFVLAVVLLGVGSIKTVGARQVGIPVTFGTIGNNLQPGVHLLAPWTQVHSCPLGEQQSIQSASPTEGDTQGNDAVPVNGNDQGTAQANLTILFHFDPQTAGLVYRKYACDPLLVKTNLIRQFAKNVVQDAASGYATTDLKTHRTEMGASAQKALEALVAPYGIQVDNVVVADIILSPVAQQAADQKLQAQQAAQQAQFHLQQAQIDAQTQKVQGEAASAANAAKTASLTPQILCEDWINAIATAKPSVVNSAGPCSSAASSSQTIVQVPGR